LILLWILPEAGKFALFWGAVLSTASSVLILSRFHTTPSPLPPCPKPFTSQDSRQKQH
jgi:hypothetical protein